jgi:4,5-dihydroxyphthalate decarboxylase
MMSVATPTVLRTVLGGYPHVLPLKRAEITSGRVTLDFVEVKPTFKAFMPMVRQQAYDLCEMAIVTYLQARAWRKPLVLLPAVMLGRFQHNALLCNAERGPLAPSDLPGRRVGVRAYTQTTGAWLRGMLAADYGVAIDRIQWVTFEDAHVAEFSDPPGVERAAAGQDMTAMLFSGELDAAIFGNDMPADPRLKSVFADPAAEAQAWYAKRSVAPINHMVVARAALAQEQPDVLREAYRLMRRSKEAAGGAPAGGPDLVPFGIDATRPALALMLDYALAQGLIPRAMTVDELYEGTPDLN